VMHHSDAENVLVSELKGLQKALTFSVPLW
jgi:hypothetical protein